MIINKKKILITAVIIILILLIFSFFYFIFFKKKGLGGETLGPKSRTLEEIIREDLTAPSYAENKISQELINTISVPAKKKIAPVSAEIIKSLTAPNR